MWRGWRGLAAAGVAICMASAAAAAETQGLDKAGWLSDLDRLRDEMSLRYANLEWAVAERGVDLPKAYADARRRIEAAPDQAAARKAMERFIAAFGDGHLELEWAAAASPAKPAASAAAAPAERCDQYKAFYQDDANAVGQRLAGFQALPPTPLKAFAAGVAPVGQRRVGVLRLPIFVPQALPSICKQVAAQLKLMPGTPCDEACEERASDLADKLFIAEIGARLKQLAEARPDVLLVDLTENGGGNDTSIAASQMVSAAPLKSPRLAFLRIRGWADRLASDEDDLRKALPTASPTDQALIRRLLPDLAVARAEAGKPCDRSPLWRGEPIACSQLVSRPLYAGGLVADLRPHVEGDAPWRTSLSIVSSYSFELSVWKGPVIVLVDRNTASASEMMASMLQDAHAGIIAGVPTYGDGCGFALDKRDLKLEHMGATVALPDCVRLRADGRNEVGGVQPDILIGIRNNDTTLQRVARVSAVLPQLVDAAIRQRRGAGAQPSSTR